MNARDLIDRYYDGRIDRAGHSQLSRSIASDPQVAAEFVASGRIHSALAQHFEGSARRRAARMEIASMLAKRQRRQEWARRIASLRRAASRVWGTIVDVSGKARQRPALTGAIACGVIAGASIALQSGKDGDVSTTTPTVAATDAATPGSGTLDDSPARAAPLLAQQVRRRLGRFYLPEVRIDALPIGEALEVLARDVDSVAERHGDWATAGIAFRLSEALEEDDLRRWRPVSLNARSVTAANALQLVAGQAGLNIAYLDGAAELKPRLSQNTDSDVRSRTFEVAADFLSRAAEIVPGEGTDSNPLAALGFSPPPSAAATLAPADDDGESATLSVRATSDDMRSIATLASMLSEARESDVEIATRVVHLPPEAVDQLAALAAADRSIGDYLTAIASPEPADRIVTDVAHYRQLVASLNELPGARITTQPTVTTGADRPVSVRQGIDPATRYDHIVRWVLTEDTSATVSMALAEFERAQADLAGVEAGVVLAIDSGLQPTGELALSGLPSAPSTVDTAPESGAGSTGAVADGDAAVAFEDGAANWIVELGEQVYWGEPAHWGFPSPPGHDPGAAASSDLVARFEGDSIRLSGTMRVAAPSPDAGAIVNFDSEDLIYSYVSPVPDDGAGDAPLTSPVFPPGIEVSFDRNIAADELADVILGTVPTAPGATEEIGIDATVRRGETLLLEIEGDDGGKQLIFVSAERR